MSINNPKDRMDFLTSAFLNMSDEDSGGFRTLVAHRPPEYRLLERRGLIYRTMTCVPERCQYRQYHGSVPSGDCRREGWTLSLRGRLVAGLLSTGVPASVAALLEGVLIVMRVKKLASLAAGTAHVHPVRHHEADLRSPAGHLRLLGRVPGAGRREPGDCSSVGVRHAWAAPLRSPATQASRPRTARASASMTG